MRAHWDLNLGCCNVISVAVMSFQSSCYYSKNFEVVVRVEGKGVILLYSNFISLAHQHFSAQ